MSKQEIVNSYHHIENSFFHAIARRPPVGFVEPISVRLLFLSLFSFTAALFLPGGLSKIFWFFAVFFIALLTLCLILLAWRWVMGHILWKVRNRLIVTCLLLALAPILLFGTLTSLAAYLFSGQFGASAAMTGIDEDLAVAYDHVIGLARIPIPILRDRVVEMPGERLLVDAWQDGKPLVPLTPRATQTPSASPFKVDAPPAWLHPGFHGIVTVAGKLYLCAAGGTEESGHSLLIFQSYPLTNERVATYAAGLGTLSLNAGFNVASGGDIRNAEDAADQAARDVDKYVPKDDTQNKQDKADPDPDSKPQQVQPDSPRRHSPRPPHLPKHRRHTDEDDAFQSLSGGTLPAPLSFFDARIFSSSPVPVVSWKTGEKIPAWMLITSRPSLLYKRLFSNSLDVGRFIRLALIVTAITFGVLELLALLLAIGLIRTITQSVADLYFATRQIETGNLLHRIRVRRRDQLAALATSFNTMSGSLAELLEQQREKDRMQNELNIAHEVQNNLFPHTPIGLPGLELYGICNPARTIGGDYYDFIPMGGQQVYLALGDISGKGISAALLMSSLHSAVRVYLQGESQQALSAVTSADSPEPLPEPGKLLSLLNQHLYSSTQPEKYATLFVASYDSLTRRLTYSNGGHLPPLVLCSNGDVQRLEAGGSVVGLLDGMVYKEATVQLNPGDLLIAYSDGLTEPEQDGVEFGEARLIEVIRKTRHRPLPAIANYTVQCLKDWMGEGEQPDDITIVFARLT